MSEFNKIIRDLKVLDKKIKNFEKNVVKVKKNERKKYFKVIEYCNYCKQFHDNKYVNKSNILINDKYINKNNVPTNNKKFKKLFSVC